MQVWTQSVYRIHPKKIQTWLKERLQAAGVSRIIIERPHKKCRVTIYAARPGVVIGKKGQDIETLDAAERGGAISFEIDGVHPHDVAQVLDSRGIAVRAGHHCAKPAHARFGVQSSTRMSSYLYTTPAEIDALVEGLEYTRSYFKLD